MRKAQEKHVYSSLADAQVGAKAPCVSAIRAVSTENSEQISASHQQLAPARISLVYESRDKLLCVFEDAGGHLTAVPASRLA